MRNLILLIFMLIFASQVSASSDECKRLLTDNFHQESSFHVVDIDRVVQIHGRDVFCSDNILDQYSFQFLINSYLERELGCKAGAVNFEVGPNGTSESHCQFLNKQTPSSFVCYLETNIGYFVANINFMEELTVIYTRWD